MTQKFIERHCKNCEFCIYEEGEHGQMYPHHCGEIDDGGGRSFGDLDKLKICKKGWKK